MNYIEGNENEIVPMEVEEPKFFTCRIWVRRNDNFLNNRIPGGMIHKTIQVGMRYRALLKEIAIAYEMEHEQWLYVVNPNTWHGRYNKDDLIVFTNVYFGMPEIIISYELP